MFRWGVNTAKIVCDDLACDAYIKFVLNSNNVGPGTWVTDGRMLAAARAAGWTAERPDAEHFCPEHAPKGEG